MLQNDNSTPHSALKGLADSASFLHINGEVDDEQFIFAGGEGALKCAVVR